MVDWSKKDAGRIPVVSVSKYDGPDAIGLSISRQPTNAWVRSIQCLLGGVCLSKEGQDKDERETYPLFLAYNQNPEVVKPRILAGRVTGISDATQGIGLFQ